MIQTFACLRPSGGGASVVFYPEIVGDVSVLIRARIESGSLGIVGKYSNNGNGTDAYYVAASDGPIIGFGFVPEIRGTFFDQYDPVDVGQVAGIDTDVWMQMDAVGNTLKA